MKSLSNTTRPTLHRVAGGWYETSDHMFIVERSMDNLREWQISASYHHPPDMTEDEWHARLDRAHGMIEGWLDCKGHPTKRAAVESLYGMYEHFDQDEGED